MTNNFDENGLRHGLWTEKKVTPDNVVWWSEGNYKHGEKEGVWNEWDSEGYRDVGIYKAGKKEGHWIVFFTSIAGNSSKEFDVTYKDGKKDGVYTMWHENGQKQAEGTFNANKKEGDWTYWDERGNVLKTETYGPRS